MAADGTCYIEPMLMDQDVVAVATQHQIAEAAAEIIDDCVYRSEGIGGSVSDIGKHITIDSRALVNC